MMGFEFSSTRWAALAALLAVACGGKVVTPSSIGATGTGGAVASGGNGGFATGGGGSAGYGGSVSVGNGGSAGYAGSMGYAGSAGSAGSSGSGGESPGCAGAPGELIKLATLHQYGGSVALSDRDVFYMDIAGISLDTNKLMRVPKAGGSALLVKGGIAVPSDLITVAGSPYWTTMGYISPNGSLSGVSGPLDMTSSRTWALTSNGARLFYTTSTAGVRSVGLTGHDVQVIDNQGAIGIAVDQSRVYLERSDGSVQTLPVTGGSESAFAPALCQSPPPYVGTVLLDQDTVYWLDACGSIWKEPKTGGTPSLIAKTTSTTAIIVGHHIAQDATRIYYWPTPDGTIQAADKSTGAVTTVAVAPGATGVQGGIAVDATSIYWTYNNALWCTRKP